jgi:hypothetical protein
MTLTKKVKEALLKRDLWCWHCGTSSYLVPHHRINRGSGGSRALDRLDNLILVCAVYNGQMESDAEIARQARIDGHKLSRYENTDEPVFDCLQGIWYQLDAVGGKHEYRRISLEDEATSDGDRKRRSKESEF